MAAPAHMHGTWQLTTRCGSVSEEQCLRSNLTGATAAGARSAVEPEPDEP